MKKIFIIFKKELKETLRDRRTLMRMMLIPLLMYPVLLFVTSKVVENQKEKSLAKVVKIGYYDNGQAQDFEQFLEQDPGIQLQEVDADIAEAYNSGHIEKGDSLIEQAIRAGELDLIVWVNKDFRTAVDSGMAGRVRLYYSSTGDDFMMGRINQMLELYKEQMLQQRFEKAGLSREFSEGIIIEENDVATKQEQLGKVIGGFLPYFFIIFCFMGAMYPAIDLAAGEKERGTIETILTSPASKFEILMGKIGVVVITGLTSAMVSILGVALAMKFADFIPAEILDVLYSMIEPVSVILIFLILLPLTVFFASFLLSVSIYSKSFKEAQSTITPLIVIVILPAFVGLLPGIELNEITALIPILNVSLVTKAIVSGTLNTFYYIEAFASLLILAAIGIIFSIKFFGRESNIMR